ncbi:ADP-ribosylglycohydrolase family protein [Pelomyxa schiedti]|nr:ADP-ribosylglycohydrolase family protein [Pelomyxa schiedti]
MQSEEVYVPGDERASFGCRATLSSLEATAAGDAFGEAFRSEFGHSAEAEALAARRLPEGPTWYWTDDTAMAIGIVEVMLRHGTLVGHQSDLAGAWGRNYWRMGPREYTNQMAEMLKLFKSDPDCWQHESSSAFNGTGSWGNGSAMRVAPLGAFFAFQDPSRIVQEATLSAQVTHFHQEATAGAIAVALAAAYVVRAVYEHTPPSAAGLFEFVLHHTPTSQTRQGIVTASTMQMDPTVVAQASAALGNGNNTSCMDTVPFTLWCAATALTHPEMTFQDVMWMTICVGGDRDTNCAIVGGILSISLNLSHLQQWQPLTEPLMIHCWPQIPTNLWPIGLPRRGRDLHPCCPHTEYL